MYSCKRILFTFWLQFSRILRFLFIYGDVILWKHWFVISVRKMILSKFGIIKDVNLWVIMRAASYTHQYYENWTTLNSYDCTVLIKHPINWDFFVPRINSYILVFIKKKLVQIFIMKLYLSFMKYWLQQIIYL